MATKYLVEVCSNDCFLTEDLVKASLVTDVQHRFKVQGESRVVAVVAGYASADKIASDIAASSADWTPHTRCVPLIPYEHFAKTSLGVTEEEVDKKGATPAFDPEKEIFWAQADINYAGHTMEELQRAWHEEAVIGLEMLYSGEVAVALYKTVFKNQVHVFIQTDAATLDDMSFQLPFYKVMGDTVSTTTRSVKLF